MLEPLVIPPGVANNGTPYQVKNRWYSASQVRWVDGLMQPIGGWAALTTAAIAHPVRGALAWTDNTNAPWCALGTSTQLLISQGAATLTDITPTGLAVGSDSAFQELGYGGTTYGTGGYGLPNAGGARYLPPSTWQLDSWGQYLVATTSTDGRVFQWSLILTTPAAVVTNAPINNAGLVVTEQQHLMLVGAGGNPKLMQWSDVENNTVWTPSTTNEAGQIMLQTNGAAMRGLNVNGQILVLTTTDAHVMTYLGQPLIWNRNRVGDKCGLIAALACTVAGGAAWWMSNKRFWMFSGSAVQPVPCDVENYVFNNINQNQLGKISAGTTGKYGEITWFYPSIASSECDSYVTYNFIQNFWQVGLLPRTAWIDQDAFPTPMAVGVDGYLYAHETGTLANGATRTGQVFATTSAMEGGNGDRTTIINQVLVDEGTVGDTQLAFSASMTPNGTPHAFGPYTTRSDGYVDTNVEGRQVTMTVTPTNDNAWTLGRMRWDIQQGSGR